MAGAGAGACSRRDAAAAQALAGRCSASPGSVASSPSSDAAAAPTAVSPNDEGRDSGDGSGTLRPGKKVIEPVLGGRLIPWRGRARRRESTGQKAMEYRLLGSLEVRSGGRVVELGPPKQRVLLAVLLLQSGEVVSNERLIELVWGYDPPRTAAHSVQIYVSGLRRALEPFGGGPAIVTRTPGYVLLAEPESIDALRFERLVAEGHGELRGGDPERAAVVLREALALWRGAPLSEFAYEEFAREPIRRLQALRLDALEELAAADLERGQGQEALSLVEAAIGEEPLRERLRELQMVALYRCGRHPDALRAYQQFHRLLTDELGLAPSPSLQRLNERVLLHDPSLALETTAAPGSTRNPYKGLRPFAEEDAGDFFGRERLVAELLASLEAGVRLVALVGPSGCGKSSVLSAGLIPALRAGAVPGSAGWAIATMMPGPHPFEQLERALASAAREATGAEPVPGDETDLGLLRAARLVLPKDGRLLLAIDQFEELFTLTDDPTAARFLRTITTAVTDADPPITVVMTLRADFYDRPLQHVDFAPLLASGVNNVLPMAADELEAAVLDPARRVGVDVDPALLAELIADTTDQLGALPLLQYALTELFERRTGSALSLQDYRHAGGLRALLSRRSEESFLALDEDKQQVALQVFLRLVNASEGARPSRRRTPLRELTALDVDPVALSIVLEEFGRHRLVSFDRDPAAGDAVVEVAHEALLWEWERLAGWTDTHREDLRRQRSLAAAADEWESTGRNSDYLITGSRLAGYATWSVRTTLRLTAGERAFLDSALERRRTEQAAEDARRDRQRRLERRAARRLWALAAAVLVLAAAASAGVLTWLDSGPPDVALLYNGGEAAQDVAAATGFDRAVSRLGIDAEKHATTRLSYASEVRRQAERGVKVMFLTGGPPSAGTLDLVADEYPNTRFVNFDEEGRRPNVTYVSFAEQEGSFLAGAAAALKSRTGVIGFIGASDFARVQKFHAGYEAGARAIDPDIRVRASYLSQPPFIGSGSFTPAQRAADRLYSGGADVIYHAAGWSGYGLFEAARARSQRRNTKLWAIGSETDQYRTVFSFNPEPLPVSPAAVRRHVLTSMVRRFDHAVDVLLDDYARGKLPAGMLELGLDSGAVELSFSGGYIDDIRPELDRLRTRIIAGDIKVPTVPGRRRHRP
jgi:basic membrane lipoprotein Med (substrate-binding protein (PBP1-ABC) superfamily)/DNA-binding SARP family transcriptional activator